MCIHTKVVEPCARGQHGVSTNGAGVVGKLFVHGQGFVSANTPSGCVDSQTLKKEGGRVFRWPCHGVPLPAAAALSSEWLMGACVGGRPFLHERGWL